MKAGGWLSIAAMTFLVVSAAVLLALHNTLPTLHVVWPPAAQHALFVPAVTEVQLISSATAPPPESACFAIGRRCFTPQSMTAGYNFGPLYSSGLNGTGKTIAIIDSFGSPTIADDLHVFDSAFNLPPMCGETGVTCTPDMPTFSILEVQGSPPPLPQPSTNNGTGQENHFSWALEVSLDVEWAHATAPGANIILVTTPTAETLGVQGFPPMMNAVQYVVDHHLADVISMSLSAGEGSFASGISLLNLRHALIDAEANGVTVLAATGDNGSANVLKEPVKVQPLIPYPSVGWPASDPLVTAVGGTYHCTDPNSTTSPPTVDSTDPPTICQGANAGQAEVGWIDGGGGYSILFPRPSYQDTLPAGSSYVGSSIGAPGPNTNMRGVPDVAYQASGRTAPLVYLGGWFLVGGTSCSTPQWAGLVAIADQISGTDLGFINPGLYKIGADVTRYANDFFDVTHGNNGAFAPIIPGYSSSTGWDAVTGLGTPNAANLAPDLVAAVQGH